MKKYFILLLLITAIPVASEAALDPNDDYDYPGVERDMAILNQYYGELKKDRRHSKEKAVRYDQIRIAQKEDEIRDKQDDFEDYLHEQWRHHGHDHGWVYHGHHDEDHHDDHHDDHDSHDDHDNHGYGHN